MQTEISLAITSARAIKDLALALIGERDRQKAAAIEVDLTKQVLDVQVQLADVLTAAIAKDAAYQAQAERVRELEAAASQKKRYRLAKAGVDGNFFVYELRAPSEMAQGADEPPHFACHPCLELRGQRLALNTIAVNGRPFRMVCPGCKLEIPLA